MKDSALVNQCGVLLGAKDGFYRFGLLLSNRSDAEVVRLREEKAMFRLWGRMFKDNKLLNDTVIINDKEDTRTHKVFDALNDICYEFDLGKPIWLESNIRDFKLHAKTRFYQDSFIEQIPFDYLEIQIIEED